VNNYLKGVVAATKCSTSSGNIGFILFLCGVGLVVLAVLLRIIRNTTPISPR
jgi:hypothetical protein